MEEKDNPKPNPFLYLIPVVALLVSLGGTGMYMNYRNRNSNDVTVNDMILKNTTITSPKEAVQKVGSHMILPTGEIPKIVTVQNVDDLKKSQAFFANAANGDVLLIYTKEVILYNPRVDRIIDIAQIK